VYFSFKEQNIVMLLVRVLQLVRALMEHMRDSR